MSTPFIPAVDLRKTKRWGISHKQGDNGHCPVVFHLCILSSWASHSSALRKRQDNESSDFLLAAFVTAELGPCASVTPWFARVAKACHITGCATQVQTALATDIRRQQQHVLARTQRFLQISEKSA